MPDIKSRTKTLPDTFQGKAHIAFKLSSIASFYPLLFWLCPLKCPYCGCIMEVIKVYYNHKPVSLQELYERAMRKYKCRSLSQKTIQPITTILKSKYLNFHWRWALLLTKNLQRNFAKNMRKILRTEWPLLKSCAWKTRTFLIWIIFFTKMYLAKMMETMAFLFFSLAHRLLLMLCKSRASDLYKSFHIRTFLSHKIEKQKL